MLAVVKNREVIEKQVDTEQNTISINNGIIKGLSRTVLF